MPHKSASSTAPGRVLLVADWNVDPQAVVDAIPSRAPAASLALLVPAKLNGLDWMGDPHASVPCARRQRDRIVELARCAGVAFAAADVGDPEPLAAIGDALADWPADRLVLFARRHRSRAPYPFDLRSRTRRLTGLVAVERVELPGVVNFARRRTWLPLRGGHCAVEQPQPA